MYDDVINDQILNKHKLCRQIRPGINFANVTIKDNRLTWTYPKGSPLKHRYSAYHKMIKDLLDKYTIPDITFNINLADHPISGFLNFCRPLKNKHEYFLIPNHRFAINDVSLTKNEFLYTDNDNNNVKNWDDCISVMRSLKEKPISTKINKVYSSFKGEKLRIQYIKHVLKNKDICNIYVFGGHPVHKWKHLNDKNLVDTIQKEKLGGDKFISFSEHSNYKFSIYIDGNTLSDRMRLLLGMNNAIIRMNSKYEEFYTSSLIQNVNYYYISNFEDIRKIINMVTDKDIETMADNNWNFLTNHLNYSEILEYLYKLLSGLA